MVWLKLVHFSLIFSFLFFSYTTFAQNEISEEWIDPAFFGYVDFNKEHLAYRYPYHFSRVKNGLDWMTPTAIYNDKNKTLKSIYTRINRPIIDGKFLKSTKDVFPFQIVQRDEEFLVVNQNGKISKILTNLNEEFIDFQSNASFYPLLFKINEKKRIPARFLLWIEKKSLSSHLKSPLSSEEWNCDLLLSNGTRIPLGRRKAFWNNIYIQDGLAPLVKWSELKKSWIIHESFKTFEISESRLSISQLIRDDEIVTPSIKGLLSSESERVTLYPFKIENLEFQYMGSLLSDSKKFKGLIGHHRVSIESSSRTPPFIQSEKKFAQSIELYAERLLSFVYREYKKVSLERKDVFNENFIENLIKNDARILPERKLYFMARDRLMGSMLGLVRIVDGSPHRVLGFQKLSMEEKYPHLNIRNKSGRRVLEITRLALDSPSTDVFDSKILMKFVIGELQNLGILDSDIYIHTDRPGSILYRRAWGTDILFNEEATKDGTTILKVSGETLFEKAKNIEFQNELFPVFFKKTENKFLEKEGCISSYISLSNIN